MLQGWKGKIANHNQLGGIETSVIDNGAGRGTRIAWINTGTGLRYKVVIDRAMDIADAFYNKHSLTWISHAGITCITTFFTSWNGLATNVWWWIANYVWLIAYGDGRDR